MAVNYLTGQSYNSNTPSWMQPKKTSTPQVTNINPWGYQTTAQGGQSISGINPLQQGSVNGATTIPSPPAITTPTNPNPTAPDARMNPNAEADRIKAEEERALQAAIGVYEAKKQGVLNRIPGLQDQLKLTNAGYDENLASFLANSEREQTSRLNDLDQQSAAVEDQYTRAGRDTRRSARALSRQLKNMFAGKGSLDSTQYQDMNIDQSRDILRTVGDMNREEAGKMTAIGQEQQDVKGYYTEQNRAETQRIKLAKEQATHDTDTLVQGIIDDANLTDAQKVESVVNAQNRLSERISQLDAKQQELAQTKQQSDRDYALKVAELKNKDKSASYTSAMDQTKALKDAIAVVQAYTQKYQPSAEQASAFAQKIFTQFGIPEEDANQYSTFFGVPTKDQTSNSLGWAAE